MGGTKRIVLVAFLVAAALPSAALAQGGGDDLLPGLWEGTVLFSGSFESEGKDEGRSYGAAGVVVISDIPFSVTVGPDGEVAHGTMDVGISWSRTDWGTTPITGDPYNTSTQYLETGVFTMSGGGPELLAQGPLTSSKEVYGAEGRIDEVSNSRQIDSTWVFQVEDATCGVVTGSLVEATPGSLLNTSLAHRETVDGSDVFLNDLITVFRMAPIYEDVDADALLQAMTDLNDVANDALTGDPSPELLVAIVEAVEKFRVELVRLELCDQIPPGFLTNATGEHWLKSILQSLIFKALAIADQFSAQQLIFVLGVGIRGGAIGSLGGTDGLGLYSTLEGILGLKLLEAAEFGDVATMQDIATAAAQYGYADLHQMALDELEKAGPPAED